MPFLWIRDRKHAEAIIALPPTAETYADRVKAFRFLNTPATTFEERAANRLGLTPDQYRAQRAQGKR